MTLAILQYKANSNESDGSMIPATGKNQETAESMAVKIFEKAYRNRRSTIDLLSEKSITTLPHTRFKLLMKIVKKRELKKHMTKPYLATLYKVLDELAEARSTYHFTHRKLPVFKVRYDEGNSILVKAKWKDISLISKYSAENGLKMTTKSIIPFRSLPYFVVTQEKLNIIVSLFDKLNAFAWDFEKSGCYDRTNLMILYLRALNVSDDHLQKIFITGVNINYCSNKGNQLTWRYHVAPLVMDIYNQKWVLDPLVSPTSVMSPEEWRAKISGNSTVVNYGYFTGSLIESAIHYNQKTNISFFSDRKTIVFDTINGNSRNLATIKLTKLEDHELYNFSLLRFARWQFMEECENLSMLHTLLYKAVESRDEDIPSFFNKYAFEWKNKI